MGAIRHGDAREGGPEKYGGGVPTASPPTASVPTLGGSSGTHREIMDGGRVATGSGLWNLSIHNVLFTFSKGRVLLNGGEGTVGGANLIGI